MGTECVLNPSSPSPFFFLLMILKAAVREGDARKLAELIRQDRRLDVNNQEGYFGSTALHSACVESHRSPVIPLLLAHPKINVNLKDNGDQTPFFWACREGRTSCVREMLKDSRVNVKTPDNEGRTRLRFAAYYGHLDVIKWWIASEREMDLGTPGDVDYTDAIGVAMNRGKTEVVAPLERFKENPVETRHAMRMELGWYDDLAFEMFAIPKRNVDLYQVLMWLYFGCNVVIQWY